ncbi:hypothetical protein [Pseudobutyrivibrio sp.]
MSSGDIQARINGLHNQISIYNGNISELEEYKEEIIKEQSIIEDTVLSWNRAYDMSNGNTWLGNCMNEAEAYQEDISIEVKGSLLQTESLIANIVGIINRISNMIDDCNREISYLQAELERVRIAEEMSKKY